MASNRTKTVEGPFHTRRKARQHERELQAALESGRATATIGRVFGYEVGEDRRFVAVPLWADGCRVEKAGLFQWVVIATEARGR